MLNERDATIGWCLTTVLAATVLVLPLFAFAEVIEVDVGAWAEIGTGTTAEGWAVSGIDRYADGLTRFGAKSDFACSPEFVGTVTQVVLRVRSSSDTVARYLTLTPTLAASDARRQTAEVSKSPTDQTFTWTLSEGVRQFRLQNDTGSGNAGWGIAALTVYTDRIEPPTGLWDDPAYGDAFTAGWDAVARAVRYEVRYASVTRVPPQFETLAMWDFSSLTNTYGGNPRTLDQLKSVNPGMLDDLSGENVCMHAYESGHLQIGTKEKLGVLVLPLRFALEGLGELTGVLSAWKHPDDTNKTTMPIWSLGKGETNDLATIELTGEKTEYRFPIPESFVAESIILSSTTNGLGLKEPHGRVRVESFAVVSGYVPGTVTTNEFKSVGTRAAERLLTGLGSVEWVWSVRAFDAEGRDSPWSVFRTVILDGRNPRRSPSGFGIFIR